MRRGPLGAVDAAMRGYLRGESLDMSALAEELGVARATLYRWVGSRERLLATVLTEATAHTFAVAQRRGRGTGADLITHTCGEFMRLVLEAEPLQVLTRREPLLYLRLATGAGSPIETVAAEGVRVMLETEVAAGRLTLAVPASVMAEAIVRICDVHVYAPLVGRREPEVDTAVTLIGLLLR